MLYFLLFPLLILGINLPSIASQEPCGICPNNCEYGLINVTDASGCRCECAINPCAATTCLSGSTCEVVFENGISLGVCKPAKKIGNCPIEKYSFQQSINKTCNLDDDCDGKQKCCNNGNTKVCKDPCFKMLCKCMASHISIQAPLSNGCFKCKCVKKKEGTCPSEDFLSQKSKKKICKTDSDCQGNRKCCSTGQGSICTAPCPSMELSKNTTLINRKGCLSNEIKAIETRNEVEIATIKKCPPVCKIYCFYGNALDKNGCKKCACNAAPIV